ncbi:hypothetical protein Peur_011856 [Populus x canadensis]
MVSLAAAFKIFAMFNSGIAQKATAITILDSPPDTSVVDSINLLRRRVILSVTFLNKGFSMIFREFVCERYKTWLWWSRFALAMTLLQTATAIYLVFSVAEFMSHDGTSSKCRTGTASNGNKWKTKLLIPFVITVCSVPLMHCFVGPAVLRWRSFYETQDDAWKAHYQEVFDHGIREALCCLGRVKYMGAPKEDEVYSVARLLGDLVAYRASGTGHLELLVGVLDGFSFAVLLENCEAAYFVVVLHHLRSVVISVRGTETPEDLITDGLGRECLLSRDDLDGLIKHVLSRSLFLYLTRHTHTQACMPLSSHIQSDVKRRVESSFPHYGHSGIVEAARDLYIQVEGDLADNESENSSGLLSSLLGAGCECDGYSLLIVGHSLGAEACSEFVTSTVHNNEFSTRLSVESLLRLRAAAIVALARDSKADKALICRLACQFLSVSMNQRGRIEVVDPSELHSAATTVEELDHKDYVGSKRADHSYSPWNELDRTNSGGDTDHDNFENPFYDKTAVMSSLDDPVSQFLETVPRAENESAGDDAEMFLPGLVIHMVPQQRHVSMPFWKGWSVQEWVRNYNAYLANREIFTDIVSPNMFFDHLPWRCHNAMRKVLESQNDKGLLDVSRIV